MSMEWAVPKISMGETFRQRQKRCSREELRERNNRLRVCADCGIVWKKASIMYRQYRQGCKEEYFPRGVMPTFKLDRKQCLNCKEKSAAVI